MNNYDYDEYFNEYIGELIEALKERWDKMRQIKRKYRKVRTEFKKMLEKEMAENKALAILVIETYVAWQYRRHIMQIWSMFKNPEYKNFKDDYTKNLMGKHITGRNDIWRSFYFAEYHNLYEYRTKIPERLATGDALGVAYKVLKK